MKKMYICWIFMIALILGSFLFIAYKFNKSNESYKIIEHDLVEAANSYVLTKDLPLASNSEMKITTSDLERENLLPNMKVDDDKCDGYVLIKKGLSDYTYRAIIECKNYKTLK